MRQTRGHKHAIGFLGSFVDDASKIESAIDANSRGGGKGKNRLGHGGFFRKSDGKSGRKSAGKNGGKTGRKSGEKSGGKSGGERGSTGGGSRGKRRRKQTVIVEEFAAGGDVYQRLMNEFCGQMPEAIVVREIMSPLLLILRFLHANAIIHRDVKPENILFAADGQLKLADFGLAICTMRDLPGARVGTLDYMAPELLQAIPSAASASASATASADGANAGASSAARGSSAEPAESQSFALGSKLQRQKSKKLSISRQSSGKNWNFALDRDRQTRASIRELLQHPWILSFAQSPSSTSAAATPSPPTNTTTTTTTTTSSSSSSSFPFPSSSSAPSSRSSLSSPTSILVPSLPSSSQSSLQSHPPSVNSSAPFGPASPEKFLSDRPWVRFAPPPLRGVEVSQSPRSRSEASSGFNEKGGTGIGASESASLQQHIQQQQKGQPCPQLQYGTQAGTAMVGGGRGGGRSDGSLTKQPSSLPRTSSWIQQHQLKLQLISWVNSIFFISSTFNTTTNTSSTSSSCSACPPNCARHFACVQAARNRRSSNSYSTSSIQSSSLMRTSPFYTRNPTRRFSSSTSASGGAATNGFSFFTSGGGVSIGAISILALFIALLGILLQVVALSVPRWPMVVTQVLGGPLIIEATPHIVTPETVLSGSGFGGSSTTGSKSGNSDRSSSGSSSSGSSGSSNSGSSGSSSSGSSSEIGRAGGGDGVESGNAVTKPSAEVAKDLGVFATAASDAAVLIS
ncbi:unnamed protein product [Closterium sp. NIES-53]